MARPPKKNAEVKGYTLRIRLTDGQRRAFEAAAKKDDRDLSSFMRQAATEKARSLGIDV